MGMNANHIFLPETIIQVPFCFIKVLQVLHFFKDDLYKFLNFFYLSCFQVRQVLQVFHVLQVLEGFQFPQIKYVDYQVLQVKHVDKITTNQVNRVTKLTN